MRTFWENESVPYAFEDSPRQVFKLLATTEVDITNSVRAVEIRSEARPITEAEATALRRLMPDPV